MPAVSDHDSLIFLPFFWCAYGLLKLALFGFVFLGPEGGFIFIILCGKEDCIRFCP